MDWRAHSNITQPEEFWALWNFDQDVFATMGLADGAGRSGVAALALLVWDIITTMDDEVNLIWPSSWTLPKSLYLFVRYYSLIILILHNVRVIPCGPWLIFEIVSTLLVELAAEVIIILRVYAVYAAQKKVLQIMVAGFVLQIAIIAVSLGVSMPKIVAGFYCQAADLPTEMVLYSCASIVYETFLFSLMMLGVIRGPGAKEGLSDTALLKVIVRDGMMAFIGIFLVMLLNTLLFTMAPTTLVTVGFPWLFAMIGALGARLVLNLRTEHAHNVTSPSSFTDVSFQVPPHVYSSVRPDDPESGHACFPVRSDESSASSDEAESDLQSDREDSALNPSRSNTGSSGGSGGNRSRRSWALNSRSNTSNSGGARSTRSIRGTRDTRRGHTPVLSDIEWATPPSPLSPETRLSS
ncbi:hypothetical protein C8Q74DRAFT_1300993 [Fomes fomentarius]|nr:hypothetical protein C8Q74DRAFT_1300993 [Fomes fomentarius]